MVTRSRARTPWRGSRKRRAKPSRDDFNDAERTESKSSTIEAVGESLRAALDKILTEPLPERLTELMIELEQKAAR